MTTQMRWKRTKRAPTMTTMTAALRDWYLQDPETDITYMKITHSPGGWSVLVCTPAHMRNLLLVEVHKTDKIALVHARAWWKQNGEAHMKLFKE